MQDIRQNHVTPHKTWCYVKESCMLGSSFLLNMKTISNWIGFHKYRIRNNLKKRNCWSENQHVYKTSCVSIFRPFHRPRIVLIHCFSFSVNSPIFTELSIRFAQNDQPVVHRGGGGGWQATWPVSRVKWLWRHRQTRRNGNVVRLDSSNFVGLLHHPFDFSLFRYVLGRFFSIFEILFWLRITDEGSVPVMRIWSILLIKSDLKWCRSKNHISPEEPYFATFYYNGF